MVKEIELDHLSRTQACYKYGIQAKSTIREWFKKYGNFDWEHQSQAIVTKTSEQKILELEAKIKLLENKKTKAEHLAQPTDKKVIIFDMLVDIAEKEYDIQIRKNYKP